MLETDEVDVDYFTPASGTSLAKIFSNNSQIDEDSRSLKYTPPLPTQVKPKYEEEKPTHCLYATALYAYQWDKDSYVRNEKVGFAILKNMKTDVHNIVLYTSNKTTLSCLSITANSVVNVKENVSISYYDNYRKYWNLLTNPTDLNKIIDILKKLDVKINNLTETTADTSALDKDDTNSNENKTSDNTKLPNKDPNKDSDTDSFVNKQTKDSILKRMATMGQSVLPTTHSNLLQTSDSSDSNETQSQHKSRHKPFKTINKKNVNKALESDDYEQVKSVMNKPIMSPELHGMFPDSGQQIVTVKTIDMVRSPVRAYSDGNDMSMFVSEQRVSNSEMRINLSRMTDKLDLVLDKVKDLQNVDRVYPSKNDSQFQNEIIHKLLKEYEAKIKNYELFIVSKGFQCDTLSPTNQQGSFDETDKTSGINNNKQCDCKEICTVKDEEIFELKEQLQHLSNVEKKKENSLLKEIDELKVNINKQDAEISTLKKNLESTLNNTDVSNKMKKVMNDAYQNISANFIDEASYTGANIKSVVASIIKKTTIECLKEFK